MIKVNMLPTRYRFNSVEKRWESNQMDNGWAASKILANCNPEFADCVPKSWIRVEWEASSHEPRLEHDLGLVAADFANLQEALVASSKRKTRSDKGVKRGKRT